eukprot:scaffold10829_cov71-Phaeocystis_antarctica.AAC.1
MSIPPPLSRPRAASGAQRGQRARRPCEAAYPQWCLQMHLGSLSRSPRLQASPRSGATASQRGISTERGAFLRGSAAASRLGC